MPLSENAHNCLSAIGASAKPFSQDTLKKYQSVPGSEEFLVEREEGSPVLTAEGMKIILSRIAEDARVNRERRRLLAALQDDQADAAGQEHDEAK